MREIAEKLINCKFGGEEGPAYASEELVLALEVLIERSTRIRGVMEER